MTLAAAEIDLRVGGRYRLANQYEDGSVLWITGVFEVIDRPRRTTYTWAHESAGDSATEPTRVTVRFVNHDQGTEVIATHHGIRSARSRRSHRTGWAECLDGLATTVPSVLRAPDKRGGPYRAQRPQPGPDRRKPGGHSPRQPYD